MTNFSVRLQRFRVRLLGMLLLPSLIILADVPTAEAQFADDLQLGGYFQGMPLWIRADLPEPFDLNDNFWEYRLQNRLNLRWHLSPELTFNWQMRTRLFAGDLVRDIPFYGDGIDSDDGLVNLSWMIAERRSWLLHHIPDRLNLEWTSGDWAIRVGRQRVNWGIAMMTNPNDLFNIYSFYDFDYPERPGSDAIRIQHFTGPFSRWELAFSPGRDFDRSIAALMYAFNTNGYDFQVIGGYYRNRLAIGGGWAGNISQSGFKGEVMYFRDLEDGNGDRESNLVAVLSADHIFPNSLFIVFELLYNHRGGEELFLLIGETLTPDNPSFSRYQTTLQLSYPLHTLLDGSLATVWYPDEQALFLSPSVTWSLMQDLDLNLLTQLFVGGGESAFSSAGNIVAASLRWNF